MPTESSEEEFRKFWATVRTKVPVTELHFDATLLIIFVALKMTLIVLWCSLRTWRARYPIHPETERTPSTDHAVDVEIPEDETNAEQKLLEGYR